MRIRYGFLLAFLLGCSQADPNAATLVGVTGTVTLDAKPLSDAQIMFVPTGDTKGIGSTGKTDAEGKYKLVGRRGGDGAVAGTYRVVISKRALPDGSVDDKPAIESAAREILPAKYSMDAQTTLTATVPEAGGAVDFALKSRADDRKPGGRN